MCVQEWHSVSLGNESSLTGFVRARRSLLRAALSLLTGCTLFGVSRPDYVVFFRERSAQLDPEARQVIAQAAARANTSPRARVEVAGYTASAGSPQADILLSQQRAQAVTEALAANGVNPSRIVRKGRGQTSEVPTVASRRVEITVGGF
jgi:outer membrane protein OmpA-like peptidoglycan-associated protein